MKKNTILPNMIQKYVSSEEYDFWRKAGRPALSSRVILNSYEN